VPVSLVPLAGLVAVAGVAPASSLSMVGSGAPALSQPGAASAKRAAVKVMETRFGPILVSGGGRALYAFGKDKRGPS
jgi:hypothetical protein